MLSYKNNLQEFKTAHLGVIRFLLSSSILYTVALESCTHGIENKVLFSISFWQQVVLEAFCVIWWYVLDHNLNSKQQQTILCSVHKNILPTRLAV